MHKLWYKIQVYFVTL